MRWLLAAVLLLPSIAHAGDQAALASGAKIYPSDSFAKSAPDEPVGTELPRVVTIVEDHEDALKVSTAVGDDCLPHANDDYAITGWVKKSALVPRLGKEINTVFPDGSQVLVDAGAPVVNGTLVDPTLAGIVGAIGVRDTWLSMPAHKRGQLVQVDVDTMSMCGKRACEPVDGSMTVNGKKLVGTHLQAGATYPNKKGYLAYLRFTCGGARATTTRVRAVPANRRAYLDLLTQGAAGDSFDFAKGPVYWSDGTPAGIAAREMSYAADRISKQHGLWCIQLDSMALPLCYRPSDSTRMKNP